MSIANSIASNEAAKSNSTTGTAVGAAVGALVILIGFFVFRQYSNKKQLVTATPAVEINQVSSEKIPKNDQDRDSSASRHSEYRASVEALEPVVNFEGTPFASDVDEVYETKEANRDSGIMYNHGDFILTANTNPLHSFSLNKSSVTETSMQMDSNASSLAPKLEGNVPVLTHATYAQTVLPPDKPLGSQDVIPVASRHTSNPISGKKFKSIKPRQSIYLGVGDSNQSDTNV